MTSGQKLTHNQNSLQTLQPVSLQGPFSLILVVQLKPTLDKVFLHLVVYWKKNVFRVKLVRNCITGLQKIIVQMIEL